MWKAACVQACGVSVWCLLGAGWNANTSMQLRAFLGCRYSEWFVARDVLVGDFEEKRLVLLGVWGV
eukprot:5951075-Amphidinium_carterae.1